MSNLRQRRMAVIERPPFFTAFHSAKAEANRGREAVTLPALVGPRTSRGSDGLLKFTNVNLVLQSEDLSNAAWTITKSEVFANAATAPDGSNTATEIRHTPGTTGSHVQEITIIAGESYTISIFLKQNTQQWFWLRGASSSLLTGFEMWWDAANNSLGFNRSFGAGTLESISAKPLDNGWFRISITGIVNPTETTLKITLINTTDNNVNTRDIVNTMYLWGVQVEQADAPTNYIKTIATPQSVLRFHHALQVNGNPGEFLGYLAEASATNLFLQSQNTEVSWTLGNGILSLNNTDVAPDGTTTADTLTDNNGGAFSFLQQDIVIPADTTSYTLSAFFKKTTGATIFPSMYITMGGTHQIFIETNTGVATLRPGSTLDKIHPVEDWGDYWRVAITHSNTSQTSINGTLFPAASANATTLGSTGQKGSIVVWGLQMENGKTPTSYIKTTVASAARVADTGFEFNAANMPETGSLELDFTLLHGPNIALGNDIVSSGAFSILRFTGATFTTQDFNAVNSIGTATFPAPDVGETLRVKLRWNSRTAKMQVSAIKAGIAFLSAEQTFNGPYISPGSGLVLAKDALAHCFRNLKIYNFDKGQSWLSQ